MKKKNLKKLSLEKTRISNLVQLNVKGGVQGKAAGSILVHKTEVLCNTEEQTCRETQCRICD